MRGYLLTVLRDASTWAWSVAATSVAFGVMHLANAGADVSSAKVAFPKVLPPRHWPHASLEAQELKHRDAQDILDRWSNLGKAEILEFTVDGRVYRLVTPSADDFFARFERDLPFAFARLH